LFLSSRVTFFFHLKNLHIFSPKEKVPADPMAHMKILADKPPTHEEGSDEYERQGAPLPTYPSVNFVKSCFAELDTLAGFTR